ncbi:MAG: hypothetical protein ABI651_08260 [Verrucomicrobiota bacterium]
MSIASDVKALVAEFEKENPNYKGKASLTSGDRSWEEQLDIILEPKRKNNYLNIKKNFLKEFDLKELPDDRSDLDKDQLAWWKKAIMAQAGKPDGFAHVGGKAQDVSIRNLDKDGREKLKEKLETKVNILMEKVTDTDSVYGVSIDAATVFHCY